MCLFILVKVALYDKQKSKFSLVLLGPCLFVLNAVKTLSFALSLPPAFSRLHSTMVGAFG